MNRLLKDAVYLLVTAGLIGISPARGQDWKFSVAASAGYGILNLNAVDEKNAADVAGWAAGGIPVGDFASVKQSPFYSARATYRSSRDFAVSLYASYCSLSVSSTYDGSDAILHLDRTIGATDVALAVAYFPPAQLYFCQWYLQANVGFTIARAAATAVGSQATKPAGVVVMVPMVDSEGKYKKTKPTAAFFVGADVPLLRPFFLKGEAGYRVAQIGELDGDITRFGVQSNQPSTTLFDFSGFLISLGLGIEL